ncbi:MAG: NAD(P)/FAD-dependent oxidoreductase [Campylobacterota bacterium]
MDDKLLEEFESRLKKEGISRRDALKLMTVGSASLLSTSSAYAKEQPLSNVNAKILIIGGGLAGISTAARLANSLEKPNITVVEPSSKSVSYQPGNTFIGAGLYTKEDILYNTKDFVPNGVKLIKDKAVEFDPQNNKVKLKKGDTIEYDFLVIAAGLVLDFTKIQGLEELDSMYTLQDSQKIVDFFKGTGANTIYNINGAAEVWSNMQKLIDDAKKGKNLKSVFTHPQGAIKCGGAPKKIAYLLNSRLNEQSTKARENVDIDFYSNSSKMFGVEAYEKAIIKQFNQRDMNFHLQHNLKKVDLKNKVATFDKRWEVKGEYDPDLEMHFMETKHEDVEVPYDFLHVTPHMKAPDEIGKSDLGSPKSWVPVKKETLQHVKYDNIFALGDIAAVPLGKTGGSVRKQYKVLADNLISLMQGKEMKSKYDGYTVCPIITDIGKVMLAEFDWSMKPTPSFPLDPTQERYIWWILKAYILKPMTQYGMLSGRI